VELEAEIKVLEVLSSAPGHARVTTLMDRKKQGALELEAPEDACMATVLHSARLTGPTIGERIANLDWSRLGERLDEDGHAVIERLLDASECASVACAYEDPGRYRNRVVMAKHGFGRGEYQYFAYPLPPVVQELRGLLYPRLVTVANRWNEALAAATRFPPEHAAYLERCHVAGQRRPTPLVLKYGAGDYNRLHQDLYGEHVFPLQVTVLLSQPVRDFTGGEFVLTEQRPRMQSRAEVVQLAQGDAVVFAVNDRPVRGTRGVYRVRMRHGVSRVRSGRRLTLGIIFHDAA
jgi:uncharacterized protein